MDKIARVPDAGVEAYIAVDSSDTHRLGTLCDTFERAKKVKFNIDHHVSNTRYGDYCFVEDRAATCEIMTELSEYFEAPLTPLAANYFMLGLSSDTGNFAHKNVTESTFLAAAKLASCGGDVHTVQYNMFKRQSPARAPALRQDDGAHPLLCGGGASPSSPSPAPSCASAARRPT